MPFEIAEGSNRLTQFALHDRALANAKIFRPLGRGAGSKAKTEKRAKDTMQISDPFLGEILLTVVAYDPVGVKEEDLLLVVLALAGLTEDAPNCHSRILDANAEDRGVTVKRMRMERDCLPHDLYEITTSPYLLLKEMSLDPDYKPSADAYAELKPRLERLNLILYRPEGLKGNERWTTGASAMLDYRLKDSRVVITLNERIARVILGVPDPEKPGERPKRHFAKISLLERFSLKSDVARILHRMFSVWVDDPDTKLKRRRGRHSSEALTVNVATLAEHVYGMEPTSERTMKYRMQTVRAALTEVGSLESWRVTLDSKKSQAVVTRIPQKTH